MAAKFVNLNDRAITFTLQINRGKKLGKFNGRAPSVGYNLACGDFFCMKLIQIIEEKLGRR